MKLYSYLIKILRYLPASIASRVAFNLLDIFKKSNAENRSFCEKSLFGGGFINGNTRNPLDACFAVLGTNNISGMVIAAYYLRKNDVVFEFGANVGTETLAFSGLVGRYGKVVAVEADLENVHVLRDRIDLNQLSHVTIVPKAVSDSSRLLELHKGAHSGVSYITAIKVEINRTHKNMIESITADELFLLYGAPKLLFMDVEGAEFMALCGASNLLQNARPIIYLEVNSAFLQRCDSSAKQIYELLHEYSYILYDPNGWSLPEIKLDSFNLDVDGEWLALPEERVPVDRDAIRSTLWRARLLPKIRYLSPLWY